MNNAALLDDTANFFLRDTGVRLQRAVEFALAHVGFVLLLYCRFLCPGGLGLWRWMQPSALWVVVFLPLFVIDGRNFRHAKYLRQHRQQFGPHDSQRYLLIVSAECSYKVLLCIYLSFDALHEYLSLQFVMLPYTAGYILHFVLGHFVPIEDAERAEGCNAVASLMSELGRFFQFVLVISLSLKVDKVSNVVYDWQAAFWPCWGLEGIIILIVVLLLPVCLVSVIVDRPRMLMLTWVLLSAGGFGASSFVSMYNVSLLLDKKLCPDNPCEIADSSTCKACRYHLEMSMWPWLAFLPTFAVITMLLKSRLATALHNSWYQAPSEAAVQAAGNPQQVQELPPPVLMFRVTATYYTRVCDPALIDLDLPGSVTLANGAGASMASQANVLHGSIRSTASRSFRPSMGAVDPMSSVLSARGATFAEIVESEQLCFVCYDQTPNAALLECGHAGMCVDCATTLMERPARQARCPICRSTISNVLRLRADLPVPLELFGLRAASQSASQSLLRANSHLSARGFGGGSSSSWRRPASREQSLVDAGCEMERGDGAATPGSTTGTHSSGNLGRQQHGAGTMGHGAASAALMEANAVAAELGQPLAAPPWPPAARRHAVMVDAIRRPADEHRGWRLSDLLRSGSIARRS